jgi:O-acetyl-ADP-ribose deacetylase (regulator of RNase III)
MLRLAEGNLFEANVEALVNAVNTVGIMGKGIALQFKKKFPKMYEAYRVACASGEVMPGRMHVFERSDQANPRYIINFPTKRHWRSPSQMEDIEAGLSALRKEIEDRGIRSVAVPPLGCGNGGLSWRDVRPAIERALAGMSDVRVILYSPVGKR